MSRLRISTLAAILATASGVACSSSDGSPPPSDGPGSGGAGGQSASSTSSSPQDVTTGQGGGGSGAGGAGGGGPASNGFPTWDDGLSCGSAPDVQVWAYDDDTYIFRQSLCTNFEGPFLYLLFGEDRAFLQDTGTGDADVEGPVRAVVQDWLSRHGKSSIQLVVTHTHSHGDHVGGDSQFAGQPDTVVVGTSVDAVATFFGVGSWPSQIVSYDLGGRVLDVLPIPGHQAAHVAVYDRRDRLLLTGDTLYPGRLYINDWPAYRESVQRMVDFTSAGNPVTWVLGTHIEMKAAGGDYAMGADQHPEEHVLQLGYPVLLELNDAVQQMGGSPSYEEHPDFIVYPL